MRVPTPTSTFALVVVHSGGRFLLVHERKHGQRWYIPAGRVEPGERIEEAAHRETREEAGIEIVLEGVLRVEHTPAPDGTARCRVFFLARPADDTPPKSVPDADSLEARWVHPDDLQQLPLRGREVLDVVAHVRAGGAVAPLHLLTIEGAPWT